MKIINKIDMSDLQKIPTPIVELLDAGATAYSDSNATTNAGRVLRFITRFLKPSTIIKMFAHKLTK